jgi:hypothetical protein
MNKEQDKTDLTELYKGEFYESDEDYELLFPPVEYTSDPYEKQLLKKEIGRWGSEWQQWIENNHPTEKIHYVTNCSWCIIPRQIDIDAMKLYSELEDRYNRIYGNTRPNGEDAMELIRWEKEKQMYIYKRIREDLVEVLYEYETEQGKSLDELPESYRNL